MGPHITDRAWPVGSTVYASREWNHATGGPVTTIRHAPADDHVPALLEIPDTPESHLGRILESVTGALARKYRAGQRAHGGCLSQKSGVLQMAEEEALDLPTYHETLREQLGHALGCIEAGLAGAGRDEVEKGADILRAVLRR